MTPEERNYFISLKQSDIDRNFFDENFTNHCENGKFIPAKFKITHPFTLKKGECANSTDVETTLGLFIFNKFIREDLLEKVMDYWNETITKNTLSKFESKISEALLNDVITVDDFAEYENRMQWILSLHTLLCGSFTKGLIVPLKPVLNKRDKLLKEHESELSDGVTGIKIEKELILDAKEALKNEPGMDLLESGARGNFNNNYKCNNIMRGPIFNPVTGQYEVAPTSFTEGLKKENIPAFVCGVVQSQYPKSVGAAVGGYTVKRFYAEYQSVALGPKGSNCHSSRGLVIQLTKSNYKNFIDRYLMNGTKLTLENIDKFIGKKIVIRSPMFCTSEKICNVCYGDLPYRLGVKNIGLTTAKIGSNFVNLGMKSFHDASLKLGDIDVENMII